MTDELEQYLLQGYQIEEIVKPHKEKAEDIIDLVRECFPEADVDIGQYRSIFYKYMKKLRREKSVRIYLKNNWYIYNLLKETNALIKRMKMENTADIFSDLNCRLKAVKKGTREETFSDNLQ